MGIASARRPLLRGGSVRRGLGDIESSSEEEEEGDAALDAVAEDEAELVAAWGAGALAANPDEEVPLVSEDTSR